MTRVCRECTNPFTVGDKGGRPADFCPQCREAREKRRKFDEQEAVKESIRIKNQGIGRGRPEGRPFQFADPE